MNNRQNFFGGFEIFDELFKDIHGLLGDMDFRNVYSASFPPANVILKKNKNLVFEFAVAGYNQDNIDISFEGDKMVLDLKKPEKKVEEEDSYLVRGIKTSCHKSLYFVPVSKYDVENTTASMKDGMLIVEIPAKEETKPRKVVINT
jgi:HSP20 family molecular chaperone IbpA